MNLTEVVGYLGTALIVFSLAMKSIVRLRIVNLTGALLFVVYGMTISSLPVIVLNSLTSLLNIYHLFKIHHRKIKFEILQAFSVDDPMMCKFMDFYRDDILSFFGVPDLSKKKQYLSLYILRDMQLAGIFIGEMIKVDSNYRVHILIDYVTPEYRDFKNSKFLFGENKVWFRKHKINKFFCSTNNALHREYLKRIGFTKQEGTFTLELN